MINNRWVVFIVCAILFLISMLYRASSAVIAPQLTTDLKLTPQELGLLGAVFFYVFALVQFPLGYFLDRFGSRRTMIFLNLLGAIGAMIFAGAEGAGGGMAGRACLGLGMSANLMGTLTIYNRWFKAWEFATISGLTMSIGTLGGLLATSPLVLLSDTAGWRGAFTLLALLNLALTLGLAIMVGDAPPDHPGSFKRSQNNRSKMPLRTTVKRLFGDPAYWTISLTIFLRYGVFAAFQTLWAGPFLILYLGLPELAAGNLLLFLNISFIFGAPIGGFLSDRIVKSRKKTVMISLIAQTLAILLLAHWPGPGHQVLLSLLFIIMGFLASFAQVLFAHIKELMPEEMAGTAMTGINFFGMTGAGVFLTILGGILGQEQQAALTGGSGYYTAFMFCFGAMTVACLLYAFTRDSRPVQEPPIT